jgi:hypothetical protein
MSAEDGLSSRLEQAAQEFNKLEPWRQEQLRAILEKLGQPIDSPRGFFDVEDNQVHK